MSKKNTQARRVSAARLSDLLVVGIFVIILLFFILFTIRHGLVYAHTNSNELYEYSGNFELKEIRKLRNTAYQFILDNGDTIAANPDIMQHNQTIEEFTDLHFLYTANTAVEITTLDEATCFLSKDASIAESRGNIYLGSFFAVLMLAISFIYWFCLVRTQPRKKRK